MANRLQGVRVAFVVANEGIEEVELLRPWRAVMDAGGTPELVAPRRGWSRRCGTWIGPTASRWTR